MRRVGKRPSLCAGAERLVVDAEAGRYRRIGRPTPKPSAPSAHAAPVGTCSLVPSRLPSPRRVCPVREPARFPRRLRPAMPSTPGKRRLISLTHPMVRKRRTVARSTSARLTRRWAARARTTRPALHGAAVHAHGCAREMGSALQMRSLVKPERGFEPLTCRLQGGCSDHLSYSGRAVQYRAFAGALTAARRPTRQPLRSAASSSANRSRSPVSNATNAS